jgi:hypothetical protein
MEMEMSSVNRAQERVDIAGLVGANELRGERVFGR